MTNVELINEAKKAMKNAYAPYSNFLVGAAVLTGNNKVFIGCNVENSSYGATICAERTAVVTAIAQGETEIIKIAIVSSIGKSTYPCGICRQFLSEFTKECIVILEDEEKGIREVRFEQLFPDAFSLK